MQGEEKKLHSATKAGVDVLWLDVFLITRPKLHIKHLARGD